MDRCQSGVFGALGAAKKTKDPRLLHNKSYVKQCVSKLCEFLSENAYPGGEVSIKAFQSRSAKEFLRVFEFLFQQLDPTFVLPKSKVDEEVPRLLKNLGYPFFLSKSSMYSVGAPHTWPKLLGALIWLIDTVKISRALQTTVDRQFEEATGDFECGKIYSVDEAQLKEMEQRFTLLTEQMVQLEQDSHLDPRDTMRLELEKLKMDLPLLDLYPVVLQNTLLEKQDTMLAEELEATGHHLDSITQEGARLKCTLADVERLNREKMEGFQKEISILSKAQEEAEQQVLQEEMSLAKVKERVVSNVAEYHKMARKLKLIPASAEGACGHDFEIQTAFLDQPGAIVHYKEQIQLPLKKMIAEVAKESERLVNKKLRQQATNEEMKGQILHKMELKLQKEHNCKLDLQLEHDMQELNTVVESVYSDHGHSETSPGVSEESLKLTVVQKLNAAKQEYQRVQLETNEQRLTVRNNLSSIITEVREHLALLEKFMEDHPTEENRQSI